MSFVEKVVEFNEVASMHKSTYDQEKLVLYFGLVMEELQEMIDESRLRTSFHVDLMDMLRQAEVAFKNQQVVYTGPSGVLSEEDRIGVLDGAVDLAVVALGAAFSLGADVVGACENVADSNLSKSVFVDGGIARVMNKDANGKVIKPPTYTPASLGQFLYPMNSDES